MSDLTSFFYFVSIAIIVGIYYISTLKSNYN